MVRRKNIAKKTGFYILVLLLVIFVAYPFVWMLSISFRYDTDAFEPGLIPERPTLRQYGELLGLVKSIREEMSQEEQQMMELIKDLPPEQQEAFLAEIGAQRKKETFPFIRFFKNSLFLAGISAFISLIIAIFGAYSFSRLEYKGRGMIQRSVLVVYLFGGTILAVPLYQIFVKLGLFGSGARSYIALVIIYVVQTLPVSLYMLGNYFRTIPYSIEEAAIIDGCSRLQTIFKVVVPLSLPAIITVYIYAFMIGWNEFLFASIFVRPYPEYYTLPIGLNELFNSAHAIWGKMMAASVVTALPVVIMFTMMEKYLTGGLTVGGVKE
ncbi:MAG: carbohydrate ABC transporter permease [Thermotogae bacterium]|uniref:Carbohydrate ABC transporter permease n=1 Tax=Kosmotoga arenicorallina TaxID=688066 RepID=A0A7C5DWY2_9BACT|nr:carbohydrate ABC transporter permease [Kosmotoga sp.]MBO8167413.1 carbohydrate ABC transporter permease [Kosmotoga sp.]MCD6159564.1 carbohydrate ABC transporter permease [Kosmotoga sp.]RKX49058.1 MAG: carbohydrate ABC transporter permease [Thermotogota bacterium]HHF08716.1 carbohydrate ABC transporter permease [Kosmotoga arenicorallina]